MSRVKLTLRLSPEIVEHLLARANRQHRGISNTVDAILCRAFRLPVPRPDYPRAHDDRYTKHPRRRDAYSRQ